MAPSNAQAAMSFVPVTKIVVILVFFGIFASTVTVTRSVVRSTSTTFKDQFRAPPEAVIVDTGEDVPILDVSTEWTSPNVDDDDYFARRDYKPLHGYIVSNKAQRFNNSKGALDILGIEAHQYIPPHYKSEAVLQEMKTFLRGEDKYLIDRHKKTFSNRMAFTKLFQQFVADPTADLGTWRFFFEDDIAVHPFLTETLARDAIARGLEVADGDGMLYLGICGPRLCRDKVVLSPPVEGKRCAGACTHAFALTKWKAGGFLAHFDNIRLPENDHAMGIYFDQLMRLYGEQVHPIWVLGSNLRSPQAKDHFGLVYQDRKNYPSVINAKE